MTAPAQRPGLFSALAGRLDLDVLQTVLTRVVLVGAGILTGALTARLLGPEGRGAYFYAVSIAALISQIGNLGFPASNTFLVAKRRDLLGALVSNSAWLSASVALMAALIMMIWAMFTEVDRTILVIAALLGGATLFFLLGSNLLVGVQQIARFNRFQLGSNALVVVCIVLAALSGTVVGFLVASLFANIVSCALLFRSLSGMSIVPASPDLSVLREGWRYSVKSYVITALSYLMLRGNVLLIEQLSNLTELGYYSIATQIGDAIGILPASVALVVFPRLVVQQRGRLRSMAGALGSVAVVLLPTCAVAALAARPFIAFVFGSDFLPAAVATQWLLPGVFLIGLNAVISQYLAAEGLPRMMIANWILGVGTLGMSATILIPRLGATGASMSFSMGCMVALMSNSALAGFVAIRARGRAEE